MVVSHNRKNLSCSASEKGLAPRYSQINQKNGGDLIPADLEVRYVFLCWD